MHHAPARIVLVTGGSRGIGAEVAQQLASPDTHVVVNYREQAERKQNTRPQFGNLEHVLNRVEKLLHINVGRSSSVVRF